MQRSLEALGTPGVQVFLHLLPSVCATAAFADIGYLSGKALQSCSVSILIFAIQVTAVIMHWYVCHDNKQLLPMKFAQA